MLHHGLGLDGLLAPLCDESIPLVAIIAILMIVQRSSSRIGKWSPTVPPCKSRLCGRKLLTYLASALYILALILPALLRGVWGGVVELRGVMGSEPGG